ncbi:hypothetical protein, partial [Chamaesiphon sp. VAR_48_metabat_403]|uniref:hypothetical protein n=1 Tax=Chamaesiphon sp. VAR_48_metabat_403 TaxID=2964700 RepID=UPI00286E8A93
NRIFNLINIETSPLTMTSNAPERQWRSNTHLRPQSIRVGRNFMLSDFLYSEAAAKKGIANVPPTPDGMEVASIRGLCEHILDPVVDRFGAISITYGYVSDALQKATYPAWKPSIHNCKPCNGAYLGAACDFQPHNTEFSHQDILRWIAANCTYDRLILYPGSTIVCVAWSDRPRSHCRQWVYPDAFSRPVYVKLIDKSK